MRQFLPGEWANCAELLNCVEKLLRKNKANVVAYRLRCQVWIGVGRLGWCNN